MCRKLSILVYVLPLLLVSFCIAEDQKKVAAVQDKLKQAVAAGVTASRTMESIEATASGTSGILLESSDLISDGRRTVQIVVTGYGGESARLICTRSSGEKALTLVSVSQGANLSPVLVPSSGVESITLGRTPVWQNPEMVHVGILARIADATREPAKTPGSDSATEARSVAYLSSDTLPQHADGLLLVITDKSDAICIFYKEMQVVSVLVTETPHALTTNSSSVAGDQPGQAETLMAPPQSVNEAAAVCQKLFSICMSGPISSQVTVNACIAWLEKCTNR